MEPTYTILELSQILKFSANSLKDPRFRQRVGLRGVNIGKRAVRFRESDVRRILNLERSSLSRNLNRLIAQGFVQKDGAVNRPMISLTIKGMKRVVSILPAWERAMDEMHSLLDKKGVVGFNNFELAMNNRK